jgi:sedoheptulokinase
MTEQFFSQAVEAFTGQKLSLYDGLNALLENTPDDGTHPKIQTTFDGTRTDPNIRGSVAGLSRENFTPGKFALGILHGMTDELFDMYKGYLDAKLPPKQLLLGSGNGLRKNRHLQRISEETFGLSLTITDTPEEAAVGAAMFARMI